MKLPSPSRYYGPDEQAVANRILEDADAQNLKRGTDIELTASTAAAQRDPRLILHSPNGTRYYLKVDNAGTLTTGAA